MAEECQLSTITYLYSTLAILTVHIYTQQIKSNQQKTATTTTTKTALTTYNYIILFFFPQISLYVLGSNSSLLWQFAQAQLYFCVLYLFNKCLASPHELAALPINICWLFDFNILCTTTTVIVLVH